MTEKNTAVDPMVAMVGKEKEILAAVKIAAENMAAAIDAAIGDYRPHPALKSQAMLVVDQLKSQLVGVTNGQLPALIALYDQRAA